MSPAPAASASAARRRTHGATGSPEILMSPPIAALYRRRIEADGAHLVMKWLTPVGNPDGRSCLRRGRRRARCARHGAETRDKKGVMYGRTCGGGRRRRPDGADGGGRVGVGGGRRC